MNSTRCTAHPDAPHVWQGPHWDDITETNIDLLICTGSSVTRPCGRIADRRPTAWDDSPTVRQHAA